MRLVLSLSFMSFDSRWYHSKRKPVAGCLQWFPSKVRLAVGKCNGDTVGSFENPGPWLHCQFLFEMLRLDMHDKDDILVSTIPNIPSLNNLILKRSSLYCKFSPLITT